MASYPPIFDELWVVSDVHMGGDYRGFQVFSRGQRLSNLIDHVTALPNDGDVALVVNGDLIDSLAEEQSVPGYVTLDAGSALRMMEHLYSDDSFAPVWDALGRFVRTPKRHLAIVVGNHDIELALPIVEDSIRRHLSTDGDGKFNESASARIHFSVHGGGYACRVGGARVFCTHGNEMDAWNWVDYNRLGQLANAINAGRAVPSSDWKPNAGTRLVVDVMNIVKKAHPFVDLLKPEVAAVASVLLALDKDTFQKVDLSDAFPVLRDKYAGSKITGDLLGLDVTHSSDVSQNIAKDVSREILGERLAEAVRKHQGGSSEEDLLLGAGVATAAGDSAIDAVAYEEGTLGVNNYVNILAGWVGLVPRSKALRLALADWIADDKTYDVTHVEGDALYEGLFGLDGINKMRVSPDVDFVITGHSHLARAAEFEPGRFYFNCGTWIRLLRLTQEAVDSQQRFDEEVWPLLKSGDLTDLDDAKIPGPGGASVSLVLDRTNAVRISREGNKTKGELLRVSDSADGRLVIEAETDLNNQTLQPYVAS